MQSEIQKRVSTIRGKKQTIEHINKQKKSYQSRQEQKCKFCDLKTKNAGFLKNHELKYCINNINRQNNILKCSFCEFTTTYKIRLENHASICSKNVSNDNKLLICPHCNKTPTTLTSIKRFHFDNCRKNPESRLYEEDTREKSKTCEYCNKKVNNSNYVRWHGKNCKKIFFN